MTTPAHNAYVLNIHDSSGLYEVHGRYTIMTSIIHFALDGRMHILAWEDLDKEIQNKIIDRVRKQIAD